MSKIKYPRALAEEVLRSCLLPAMRPLCAARADGKPAILVCGSFRRMKEQIGDVEIVYISQVGTGIPAGEMLPREGQVLVDLALTELLDRSVLDLRKGVRGGTSWGKWIKFAVHRETGLPVDFFRTISHAWWNTVVCRTGGEQSNIAIASAAMKKGWRWDMSPTSAGFKTAGGGTVAINFEGEAFTHVGLPFVEPRERE